MVWESPSAFTFVVKKYKVGHGRRFIVEFIFCAYGGEARSNTLSWMLRNPPQGARGKRMGKATTISLKGTKMCIGSSGGR